MELRYSFAFILLLAQNIPSSDADCSYDKSLSHCSCSLLDLTNIMSIISCLEASSFEFNDGSYQDIEDFTIYNMELQHIITQIRIPLTKISLVNVVLSEEFLFTFINWVHKIPINLLAFENTTIVGQYKSTSVNIQPPRISSLQFVNMSSHPLMLRDSAFGGFGNWMSTLGKLTVMRSHLKDIPCSISTKFGSVFHLDLSENLLQDENISSTFCNGAFPRLNILKLRHNNLVNYETVCQTLRKYDLLKHLDLSQNNFSTMSNINCEWQSSLINLNLSNTGLKHVHGDLPQNCEVLDLSHNKIEFLNISLGSLKKLYLSNNMFTTISSIGNFPHLQVLAVDGNHINTLHRGELQYFNYLKTFKGDNNPYTCTCSFVNEMKEITEADWTIQHWPEGYICSSPTSVQNLLVNDVSHSFFECHTHLLIVLICIIILLLSIAIIICFVKIHRSNKTRSQRPGSGNSNSIQFQ